LPRGERAGSAEAIMRIRTAFFTIALLVSCHQHPEVAAKVGSDIEAMTPAPATEQVVSAELGKRPPNTRLTSKNMPFFDIVTYCLLTTRRTDTMAKGPAYETCIGLQDATRVVIGEAIDAKEFEETDIVRCAKASHTAYEGMWYCMNGEAYR
jgi:hypothetical protein